MNNTMIGKNEKIIIALNDHWVVMIKPVCILMIGWALCIFLGYLSLDIKPTSPETSAFILIANYAMIVSLHHWFFVKTYQWIIFDSYITTEKIIVFHIMPGVLSDVTFINIADIHGIEQKQKGLLQNILNYGSVIINIATVVTPMLRIDYVTHPGKFINLVQILKSKGSEANIDELRLVYQQKGKKQSSI